MKEIEGRGMGCKRREVCKSVSLLLTIRLSGDAEFGEGSRLEF